MMRLRDYTAARVELGRVGHSLPTARLLEFQLAHARARDAVHLPLNMATLVLELNRECLVLKSAAPDRATFLRRPDLGRRLSTPLNPEKRGFDAVMVVADGLSALAVHRHAVPLLNRVFARLHWTFAPVVIVEQGRVAIGDEIGQAFDAALAVVLIGERPGLSSPDSLGVYVTWSPKPGRTEAERNCISNVRPEGLSYDLAAHKLLYLMTEARQRKLTGVNLKEDAKRGDRPRVSNFLAHRISSSDVID
jgi:ethanolamine ammonia-lyase small subunit